MAISPMPASKSKRTNKPKNHLSSEQKSLPSPLPKRRKCPGVRVVGNRIYDSKNGTTCHQCRQKTMDFVAACKNENLKKPCTFKFCHKCLLNRYGEKAEEMAKLDDWKCPRCRSICNCSRCMKEKGHPPTGILAPIAKATGFSSVSELLHLKGPEAIEKVVKNSRASPNKQTDSSTGLAVYSKRKRHKEKTLSDQGDSHTSAKPLPANCDVKLESKKIARKKLKLDENKGNVNESIHDDGCLKKKSLQTKKPKKSSLNIVKRKERMNGSDFTLLASEETEMPTEENAEDAKEKKALPASKINKLKKHGSATLDENGGADVTLPQGKELTGVAGMELAADDVGPALQFLEFCTAFGEVLDLKNGQPELILRELIMHRRARRRGPHSSFVQFHIRLLSVIQKDLGEEDTLLDSASSGSSWLRVLHKCISESQFASKDLPVDCIARGADEYEKLDSSEKLKILNFLCDEALCTESPDVILQYMTSYFDTFFSRLPSLDSGDRDLRGWMDKENSKFVETRKEVREKLLAAKEKVNHMKKKLKDEVVRTILSSRDGGPLSVHEHENLLSKIRSETKNAQDEKLEAMNLLPKKKQRPDVIRTDPVLFDGKGRAYWRLRGCSNKSRLLLQVIENLDMLTPQEKWFTYDEEQEKVAEKYIFSFRKRQRREHVISDGIAFGAFEASQKHHSHKASSSRNAK